MNAVLSWCRQREIVLVSQVSLWLLRVGVSVVARADVLPVDDVLGKLREVAGEEVAATINALDLPIEADDDIAASVGRKVEVFQQAYDSLVEFVEEEEKKFMQTTRTIGGAAVGALSGGTTPIAGTTTGQPPSGHTAGKRSFETDMELVHRNRGGSVGGIEYAWVRKSNVSAWK